MIISVMIITYIRKNTDNVCETYIAALLIPGVRFAVSIRLFSSHLFRTL